MYIQIFIAVLLLSLVKAASKYYDGPIRPYEFGFNIEGHQHRRESKDENGVVMGEFGFITADNVYHVTVYATDENGNFKIVSMKNYKLGATASPAFGPAPRTPNAPFATSSTTPQPFRIITTAKPLTTAQPSGLAACGGCIVPELTTTTPKPIPTENPTPETSTQIASPFRIVNKNDIESIPTTSASRSVTTMMPNNPSKSNSAETPQKLIEKQQDTKAFNSKESTKSNESPATMQTRNKSPTTQTQPQPQPTAASNIATGSRGDFSEKQSDAKPKTSNAPQKSSPMTTKLDRLNTANMMIQHILNGLLYRFNYTVGYHGHHEQGDRQGNKEGGYYSIGRDGIRRGVTYKANEFGFQPHITFDKVAPEETPREETEKQAGLKGFDFKWFWGES